MGSPVRKKGGRVISSFLSTLLPLQATTSPPRPPRPSVISTCVFTLLPTPSLSENPSVSIGFAITPSGIQILRSRRGCEEHPFPASLLAAGGLGVPSSERHRSSAPVFRGHSLYTFTSASLCTCLSPNFPFFIKIPGHTVVEPTLAAVHAQRSHVQHSS